jgi:hypothetical protein
VVNPPLIGVPYPSVRRGVLTDKKKRKLGRRKLGRRDGRKIPFRLFRVPPLIFLMVPRVWEYVLPIGI